MKTVDNNLIIICWSQQNPRFNGTHSEAIQGVNTLIDLKILTLDDNLRLGVGNKWWTNPNIWSDFCLGKGIGEVV